MGTGKTEVGRILAKKLGYIFVDVDHEIEKGQKMTVAEIFRLRGEDAFRDLESDVIKRVSEMDKVVIATGGGAVLRQENRESLRKKGIVVCLTAAPETLLKRTRSSRERPLLHVEDPLQRIKELLDFRRPYYEKADIIVDTEGKSPFETAEEIRNAISDIA